MQKFYFAYFGSKKRELSIIMPMIDDIFGKSEINKVCEPFGGSCIISQQIFKKYDNKVEIYISDIDEQLVNFCNNFYKNKNEIVEKTKIKCMYYANNRNEYSHDFKNQDKTNLVSYFLFQTYYNIRHGLQPINDRVPKYIGYDAMTRE